MRRLVDLNITVHPVGTLARPVISRSKCCVTAKIPSHKVPHRLIFAEGPLEIDAVPQADADPGIKSLQEQPALIEFSYQERGVTRTEKHYPDLLLNYANRRTFVEIKWQRYAMQPEVAWRTELLKSALPNYGYGYELWTEREIREPPARLQNALLLLRYGRRRQVSAEYRERIRLFYASGKAASWGDIRGGLFGRHGLRDVCSLILDGYLQLERLVPITDRTEIRWAGTRIRPPPPG